MIDTATVVVLGLSATAKYVVREANQLGAICWGLDTKKGATYYSNCLHHAQVVTEQELLDLLETTFRAKNEPIFVCPTSDEWVDFIARTPIFKEDWLHVDPPYLDGSYREVADKNRLQQLAMELNLAYPKSITFIVGESVPDLTDLQFPLFCKPSDRVGLADVMQGKKGWILSKATDLQAVIAIQKLQGVALMVQEIIEGAEQNIKVLAAVGNGKGEMVTSPWTGTKVRQYPPQFGSGSLVVQSEETQLERIAKIIIQHTQYQGFLALEAKYCDRRKDLFIIEINTRPSLWFSATTASHAKLVGYWMNTFDQIALSTVFPKSDTKVIWRYGYKDIYARLKTGKSNFSFPQKSVKIYAVWDKNDLKPFFYDLWNGLSKLFKRF